MSRYASLLTFGLALALFPALRGVAQPYPVKPVRLIVPGALGNV